MSKHKFDEEMTKHINATYSAAPNMDTVRQLAIEYDVTVRSIVAKLVKEGIYKKTEYRNKLGEIPRNKEAYVEDLLEELGLNTESHIDGLLKANKFTVRAMLDKVRELKSGDQGSEEV